MCNICGSTEEKYVMTGLSGKMCENCRNAVLMARKGSVAEAKQYFDTINFSTEDALKFVRKELDVSANSTPSIKLQDDSFGAIPPSSSSALSNDHLLKKISSDICTIKNVVIIFLVLTGVGLFGTLIYIMQLVNSLKGLF